MYFWLIECFFADTLMSKITSTNCWSRNMFQPLFKLLKTLKTQSPTAATSPLSAIVSKTIWLKAGLALERRESPRKAVFLENEPHLDWPLPSRWTPDPKCFPRPSILLPF